MAKTAVVNPRKRRRSSKRRRRRNPSASNPRRRRRHYGAAPRRRNAPRRRRRRNPGSAPGLSTYSSRGYRRKPNPDLLDFDHIMSVLPAATLGDFVARWAVKTAGPMESADEKKGGPPVPGVKHAIACILAARIGSGIVGSVLGDAGKGVIAEHAALGFAGSLFARKRFFEDNKWLKENLYLDGEDEGDYEIESDYSEEMNGFENQSALGEIVYDEAGNAYMVAGPDPAMIPQGTRGGMGGFENQSALGALPAMASAQSSFGYVSR